MSLSENASKDTYINGAGHDGQLPEKRPSLKGAPLISPPLSNIDGKRVLQEEDCYEHLGFSFPTWKKWAILSVIFAVQVSMNFNTSIYANAISGMSEHFQISAQAARVGQMIFLIAYAFGSELWAPWSEELGRWPIMQLSLFLVNVWQLPCAMAPNFGSMVVGRFLGGLSSAGGSVTLGMVADMWEPNDQQYAVAFIVFSSVGGSVVGPIVGAFIEANLNWRWIFWIQLIFGGAVQAIHFVVPETRVTILIDREAKKRRAAGEKDIYGPNEIKEHRITTKEVFTVWARPFEMFIREPIVLCLSLLSGFSDALIFTFLESYSPVYKQWGFGVVEVGLAFIPYVGFLALPCMLPAITDHPCRQPHGRVLDRLHLLLPIHSEA
jgi:MFS family permease